MWLFCILNRIWTFVVVSKEVWNVILLPSGSAFQNECHAKDDIRTTLSFGCCKVVSFFSTFSAGFFVWEFSFNHEQHCYETALVPLRRVKYYKHVKSDLCYNITWRNRPTELAGEQQLTRWMFSSNRDYRTYLSPLQLKGTVELVEVSQLSSYQPSKHFLLFGHGSKPLSKYTRVHRLTKDFLENFG